MYFVLHHRKITTMYKYELISKNDCKKCKFKINYKIFLYSTTQQSTNNQSTGSVVEGLNSPLIQDDADGKTLKLRFDVSQYAPEEIVLKTVDNKLLVSWRRVLNKNSSIHYNFKNHFIICNNCNLTGSRKTRGKIRYQVRLPRIQSWIFTSNWSESRAYSLQFI